MRAVGHHVPGVRGVEGGGGEHGIAGIEVGVIAVVYALGGGVVEQVLVARADEEGAAVAAGIEAQEALARGGGEGIAGDDVQSGQAALVGVGEAGVEGGNLGDLGGAVVRGAVMRGFVVCGGVGGRVSGCAAPAQAVRRAPVLRMAAIAAVRFMESRLVDNGNHYQ